MVRSLVAFLAAACFLRPLAADYDGPIRESWWFLYVVLSCRQRADLWPEVRAGIRDRKGFVRRVFVVGDDRVDDPIGRLDGDVLSLRCGDAYENLPEKMVFLAHAVRRLEAFKDVTHVVKVDEHDSRLAVDDIHALATRSRAEAWDYRGSLLVSPQKMGSEKGAREWHFGKVTPTSYWHDRAWDGTYGVWLSGGQTYVLSARALDVVVAAWPVVDDPAALARLRTTHVFEDVMIGAALAAGGVEAVEAHYGAVCIQTRGHWAPCASEDNHVRPPPSPPLRPRQVVPPAPKPSCAGLSPEQVGARLAHLGANYDEFARAVVERAVDGAFLASLAPVALHEVLADLGLDTRHKIHRVTFELGLSSRNHSDDHPHAN